MTTTVDMDKLMAFVGRAVDEIGATLNTALVVMGDRLGYYRALAAAGPMTPRELAGATGTGEPYAREWLAAQAAGGYVEYDPPSGRFTLPPEQAVALVDEDSPAFLPGFFQIALGTVHDSAGVVEAARTGGGVGWHEHDTDVHVGCERFFRPGYLANLVPAWLPALDGVVAELERGATVADVGCGHGASTILMAQAFPRSRFVGSDYHAASVECARDAAARAGVALDLASEGEPPELAAEHPLVRLMEELAGRAAVTVPFGTDAVELQALAPCVVLGPGDIGVAHTPEERVPVAELAAAVPLFRRFLERGAAA